MYLEKTVDNPCLAETAYRHAVQLEPNRGSYHFNLGNALLGQHLLADAAAAFQRALELEPHNADAMNNLAWTHLERGDQLDEAVALCRRAATIHPARRAYYLDTLGRLLLKQGKPGEARTTFEQALAATTNHQLALRESIRSQLAVIPDHRVRDNPR